MMYVTTTMTLEGREKLAEIIGNLVGKYRSVRAFAKKLNVSHTTVMGWQRMTSVPDTENLKKIAWEAGFTLSELQELIDGRVDLHKTTVDRVIYEVQQLSNRDIAKVIEAAARCMAKAEYGEA